jgi:tyrosine-specific transport protein
MPDKNYIYAVSALVGATIGAGIFGLPYAAAKAGFIPAVILLIALGIITIITNLMFAEVTLRTNKKGRLVLYCQKYIGKSGKTASAFIALFSLYSSMLAYIILGGMFLNSIFFKTFGGDEIFYSSIVFIFATAGIYARLKLINIIELAMVILLFTAIFGIMFKGVYFVNVDNLLTYNISQSFFPFGVIIFSMGALSVIPEFEHIIRKKQERIKSAIILGTSIPIATYLLFMAVVVGVTGQDTTSDALSGLNAAIGNGVMTLGLIFGILAIITSYLIIGINLKEIFWYDYGISEKKSWALACFVPYVIFVLGLRDFITVVNFTGGVAGGLTGIIVVILFYAAKNKGDSKPPFEIKIPLLLSSFIVLTYLLGIFYQFVYQGG